MTVQREQPGLSRPLPSAPDGRRSTEPSDSNEGRGDSCEGFISGGSQPRELSEVKSPAQSEGSWPEERAIDRDAHVGAAKTDSGPNASRSDPLPPNEGRSVLQSVFGQARPAVIYFRCVVASPVQRYSSRLVATPSLRFYYHHSSAVHRYNCVLNTLEHNGGVSLTDGPWGDVRWSVRWDGNSKPEVLKKMHALQKTNHFPGSFQMGWKDSLCLNIERLQRRIGPSSPSIIPQTYVLPKDFSKWNMDRVKSKAGSMWIFKPRSSSCGRGIKLIRKAMSGAMLRKFAMKAGIIQKYIGNPLLLNGFKCDLRLYVLVTSVDPLKIYLYDEGLVRIATQPYVTKGRSKCRFMHLTNYSINKRSSTFVKNEDTQFGSERDLDELDEVSERGSSRTESAPSVGGSNMSNKWSLEELRQSLTEADLDFDKMMRDVEDIIIKTVISAEPQMATNLHRSTNYSSCAELGAPVHQNLFEIYGFDILVDANLRPWLLEVNVCPSFSSSSPLDKRIKSQLMADTFTLVGFWPFNRPGGKINPLYPGSWKPTRPERSSRASLLLELDKLARKASSGLPLSTLTEADWASIMDWHDEEQRAGGYRRIYPTRDNAEHYGRYLLTERSSNLLFRLWLEAGGAKVFDPSAKEFSFKPKGIPSQVHYD
ncbi:hypothetical protein FOZ63_030067 [Perkinsus olseni]|uniref:Tubulin--tyrosine ligase-like protein 5 n=1 Tax=Perkinsus olseni TaxID=32597 RepID=A0A7J6Q080_PEROL|nr:hypothetical protein FOZ63_030067 [Perkinsus olseni]